DANGILNVSAKDLGTGKEQSIEIKSSSGLSDDEIKKMTVDAEAHAEEDKKKREVVDLKNQADQLVYSTEKTLKEHGDKVSDEERANVESAVEKLKKALEAKQIENIKKGMEELTTASHKLAEMMYKEAAQKQAEAQAQAGGASGTAEETKAGTSEPPGDQKRPEDVVDADYEVVDDDNDDK
ncbi:MAG: Hsp70 family protein, partial [Thermoplasmata archaeon]|nr:Hsp70 family protein [Thermoplasmata archaeon]